MKETEKCTVSLPRGWSSLAREKNISLSGVLRNGLAPKLDLTDEEIRKYGNALRMPTGRPKK